MLGGFKYSKVDFIFSKPKVDFYDMRLIPPKTIGVSLKLLALVF